MMKTPNGMTAAILGILLPASAAATVPASVVPSTAASSEVRHDVIDGDTLWKLASRYYKDPYRWEIIYKANEHMIHNPHWIYPGEVLIIPGLPPAPPKASPAALAAAPVAPQLPPPPPALIKQAPSERPLHHPSPKTAVSSDSISDELPPGLPGATPSEPRFRVPAKWRPDAVVPDRWPSGASLSAAPGQIFEAEFPRNAAPRTGAILAIFRHDARHEDDPRGSRFIRFIGTASVSKRLGSGLLGSISYELRVVKAVDMVQGGDILNSTLPNGGPIP